MPARIPVLIAGAGPVGLTLAAELAWRGVGSLVVDPQAEVHPHPRAISIGVRTMEHYRRLGLDQAVIDAGVPRNRALDVVYVTRMLEREIFRFRIPSIADLEARRDELATSIPEIAASPYYKCWTAQSPLERVLRRHAQGEPLSDLRLGWKLERFEERGDGVSAVIADAAGRTETVEAEYLAGCDGASSTVRAGLGIKLAGRGTLGEACGLYFRAPGLDARLGANKGVMYWTLAPGVGGVIYTIDGGDEWVFNRYFAAGEARIADPVALVRAAVGADIGIEILSVQSWLPRQLVAESYGTRRVFLLGDACHLFVPTGGFGMNTGVGDAVDLAWKIDAVRRGWGGAGLLGTYDMERRPVGTFNTLEAADNYARSGDIYGVPLEQVAAQLPPKIKHFAPIGVHLGYRYEGSPLIVPDGTPAPPMETATYTPTARPGHRAPHAWMQDAGGSARRSAWREGGSTLDLFGRGFTLLRFGAKAPRVEFPGIPLAVVDIDDADIAALYERRLVLVRPDGHVAWRADDPPADARAVADTVRGINIGRAARDPARAGRTSYRPRPN